MPEAEAPRPHARSSRGGGREPSATAPARRRTATSRHLALLGLCAIACVTVLVALTKCTIRYAVDATGEHVVLTVLGQRLVGPSVAKTVPLVVILVPGERYSTGELLIPDRGFLRNSLAIVGFLITGPPKDPVHLPQAARSAATYVHFNPFRSRLVVRAGDGELSVPVNLPDASVEFWEHETKLKGVPVKPPWVRLTLAPLLAAGAAAVLVCALLALVLGPRTPERDAVPAVEGDVAAARRVWLRLDRVLPALVFLAGALVVAGVFLGVFEAMPGFGDEMNYLIQGRIFASGRLSVPEPPDPAFFRVNWMDMFGKDGKVWGFHPPGNSALLALGWLIGARWLPVVLVGGLILAVQYLLALELLGRRWLALLHVAIIVTSHYFLSLACTYMAHAPSMLFLSLFFLAVVRFIKRRRPGSLLLAALWSGLAFVVRPLSAVLAALIPLIALLFLVRRRLLLPYGAALVIGLAVVSTTFLYTYGITGRFELPYLVKGPEMGQTVAVRLAKSWQFHLSNLYRNCNEFQHRAHSFGMIGNLLFFFIPLVSLVRKDNRRWWWLAGYGVFGVYVVAHSLLHWYGWKWEPRMLYDISFVYFLLTSAGVSTLLLWRPTGTWKVAAGGAAALALAFVAVVDLPFRFSHEYHNYNSVPTGVRHEIARQSIHDAIVFFGAENAYACYAPMNSVLFDGDIVYAKSVGELFNYRLLERFPNKRVYFSPDGMSLAERANFYRHDFAALARELDRFHGRDMAIVMPWARAAPSKLNDALSGRTLDAGEFLDRLVSSPPSRERPLLVTLLESATNLAPLLDRLFETSAPPMPHLAGPVAVREIGAPRGPLKEFPGLLMLCFEGTTWNGRMLNRRLVSTIEVEVCPGEYRSVTWDGIFDLKDGRSARFSLESDDGSGLFIDGVLVLDNDLSGTHGPVTKTATVSLTPGRHAFRLKYFNGPDGEFVRLSFEDRAGRNKPVSVAGFLGDSYIFVDAATFGSAPARK
jgi:hypothetical protein